MKPDTRLFLLGKYKQRVSIGAHVKPALFGDIAPGWGALIPGISEPHSSHPDSIALEVGLVSSEQRRRISQTWSLRWEEFFVHYQLIRKHPQKLVPNHNSSLRGQPAAVFSAERLHAGGKTDEAVQHSVRSTRRTGANGLSFLTGNWWCFCPGGATPGGRGRFLMLLRARRGTSSVARMAGTCAVG